jgi:nitroreductase
VCVVAFLAGAFVVAWAAGEATAVKLPAPQMEGGMPLMQALKARHTSREFDTKPIPDQLVANLLWAANGINRPDGKRTAPSAVNWQETDIYVFLPQGTYVYDAKANAITPVGAEDLRALTGVQAFAKTAPLSLVYIADYAKITGGAGRGPGISEENRAAWTSCDVGFIAQNVYLFCASEGLNTGVRAMIDKDALGKALKLRPEQHIILAQSAGYPK